MVNLPDVRQIAWLNRTPHPRFAKGSLDYFLKVIATNQVTEGETPPISDENIRAGVLERFAENLTTVLSADAVNITIDAVKTKSSPLRETDIALSDVSVDPFERDVGVDFVVYYTGAEVARVRLSVTATLEISIKTVEVKIEGGPEPRITMIDLRDCEASLTLTGPTDAELATHSFPIKGELEFQDPAANAAPQVKSP
jgi:hypothetical protein